MSKKKVRPLDIDICFFVEPGGFVRIRGNGDGIDQVMHQLLYRCGVCGAPVLGDGERERHFSSHANKLLVEADAVRQELEKEGGE